MTESRHLDRDPSEDLEIRAAREAVRLLDPELFDHPKTRQLVELGLVFGHEVTAAYGTPDRPRWASGTYEQSVVMAYHNGGRDGHTSVGPEGAGVPRNVLLIAHAVNQAAGAEVYDPLARATAFCAAEAHDRYQLCGRTLMPEGQGEGRGDERLSAQVAHDRYLEAGGHPEVAGHIYNWVSATAYNPEKGTQNVTYGSASHTDIMGRELVAAADLLAPCLPRGPLASFEYAGERLCLVTGGRLLQQRLPLHGVTMEGIADMPQLLRVIGQDEVLHDALTTHLEGDVGFYRRVIKYSDSAIRAACGKGIDDLFTSRLPNSNVIEQSAHALRRRQEPLAVWHNLRIHAGYAR